MLLASRLKNMHINKSHFTIIFLLSTVVIFLYFIKAVCEAPIRGMRPVTSLGEKPPLIGACYTTHVLLFFSVSIIAGLVISIVATFVISKYLLKNKR